MTVAAVPNTALPDALATASALVALAEARAVALALDEIGDVVIPDAAPATADDQALIRAIGPLYLAAQLEQAALVPSAETFAALSITGGLPAELGAAADLVRQFWQQRNQRFHADERREYFARFFGLDNGTSLDGTSAAPPNVNVAFEDLMIDLAEALYKLDEESPGGNVAAQRQQTRVVLASRRLAGNLLGKGGGMTPHIAGEILSTIQEAIRILQRPEVQQALGARSLWTAVLAVAKRYLHIEPDTASYVSRGKSGLVMLSWLADSLPRLDDRRPLVALDHPVIPAATEWLQASLAVREAAAQPGA